MINEDRNTFLSINLDAINKNFEIIKKKVGKRCTVASTVKADAYGLGADKVVPSLIKNGCKFFFVATTNEAIQLRKINKSISIFILNGLVTTNIAVIEKYNLIPVINNLKQLKKIVGLKFDTVLFDNMNISNLKKGVKLAKKYYETEASGNINIKNVKSVAASGVDRISIGAITHSVKAIDLKLEFN